MILRPLNFPKQPTSHNNGSKPASEVFIQTEKQLQPPFGIIFQAEHSVLAGHLAKAFLPTAFGELPPEVIQAISQHDFGWKESDQAQMDLRSETTPRPFPALS